MAHNIEIVDGVSRMFYTGATPWHGLGIRLDQPPTAEEAIIAAGLNWTVEKIALDTVTGLHVPEHMATVRDSDQKVLGVVGNKYRVLQNKDAFRWFDPVIESKRAEYHTAGSLRGGSLVWVLAKLDGSFDVGEDDKMEQYLLLTTSHDGSRVVSAMISPVRVVCANTLDAALASGDAIRIMHTESMEENLKVAQNVLGMVDDSFLKTAETYRKLAARMVTVEEVQSFIETVFPIAEDAKVTTRTENIRDNVVRLFEGEGMGAKLKSASGTAWGLYNAVTEYVDHVRGADKDREKRMESVLLTSGKAIKRNALQTAIALAA